MTVYKNLQRDVVGYRHKNFFNRQLSFLEFC